MSRARQTGRRVRGLVLAAPCVLFLAGCGASAPRNSVKAAKTLKKVIARQEVPGEVRGTGWRLRWETRVDTKQGRRSEPVIYADARDGIMETSGDDVDATVHLNDVHARLYRHGVHAADIAAPRVIANRRKHVVVGTGGVTVRSLTNPPDTVVTAERITWDVDTDKMLAVGGAHVVRHPHNGGVDMSQRSNRILFDSRLNSFISE